MTEIIGIYRKNKGVTMVMVIIFGMIMMAMAVILLSTGSENLERVFENKEKLQALYMARGGQQHALLKFRLLPTPFYDAAAYAIGKNPYFDFTRPMDRYTNPGPAFFTGTITGTTDVTDASGNTYKLIERDPNSWSLSNEDKEFKGVMAVHLNRFLKDVATDYPQNSPQKAVWVSSDTHNDFAFGSNWVDPFKASYLVDRVFIFGSQGALNYSTDSVLVSCKGTVYRANHKSLITAGTAGGNKDITRQFQKYSTSEAGSGFTGMTDSSLSNAEKFQFLTQYQTGLASASRSYSVTAVYEVHREK